MGPSSRVVSTAILHRHGARGPGDSETSPWEETDEVVTQWREGECENLTKAGIQQIRQLGQWFAKKCLHFAIESGDDVRPFFRCSKSDRAKESGRDFVIGFNETMGREAVPEVPCPYEIGNTDHYFRPWKVHSEKVKSGKTERLAAQHITQKAEENRSFLEEVYASAEAKHSMLKSLNKALWSTTHICGILECESFWPMAECGPRNALSRRISREQSERVTELACFVWEERFFRSGHEVEMGGWMFLDIIQQLMDPAHNANIFSGHDYTILGVLATAGLATSLKRPVCFGSYLVFELCEDASTGPTTPSTAATDVPAHSEGSVETTAENDVGRQTIDMMAELTVSAISSSVGIFTALQSAVSSCTEPTVDATPSRQVPVVSPSAVAAPRRFIRIKLNSWPFERESDTYGLESPRHGEDKWDTAVRDDREEVLSELSMAEVKGVVDIVVDILNSRGVGLPPDFRMPEFF